MIKYLDITPFPASVGVTTSETDYIKEMKRLHIYDPPPFTNSGMDGSTNFFIHANNLYIIVTIKANNKTSKKQLIGLVVHEAVHVWQAVLESIGEDNCGDEITAYNIQNIVQFMLKELKI